MPESKLVAAIARREVSKMDLVVRLRDDDKNCSPELAWEAADALEGATVLRKALIQQVKRLTEALAEANEVLRSTYQIAARSGAETNWPPFTARVEDVLKKQHAILHAQPE